MDSDRPHFSSQATEAVAPPFPDHPQQGAAALTFGGIMDILNPFLQAAVVLWGMLMTFSAGYLFYEGSDYAVPFCMAAFSTIIPLWIWRQSPDKGVPYMLVFVLFQAVFLLTPMLASNRALLNFSPELIRRAAIAVALFFATTGMGWRMVSSNVDSEPSRWSILGDHSEAASLLAMRIASFLLMVGLVGQIVPFVIDLGSLWPVVRAGTGAAASLGALLGGYAQGIERRMTPGFWILLSILFFISIHDVLISAAAQIVLASILGLALGSRKIPWKLLLIIVSLISFLNLGKFIMRARYWNQSGTNTTGVTLMQLPSLYAEWFQASLGEIAGTTDPSIKLAKQMDDQKEGDFSARINTFENVLFVTQAVSDQHLPLLYGNTYTLIPPLLLPRFLWPNKPRAHAGQDLLNIHFQRQREVDVERTFIAWGVLAEGIGNFGLWLGPIFVGLLAGMVTGWLEAWSVRKEFFSVEGFLALGLLLQTLISYEMVSSIMVTSAFQMVVVCLAGGFMIRNIFAGGGPAPRMAPMHD